MRTEQIPNELRLLFALLKRNILPLTKALEGLACLEQGNAIIGCDPEDVAELSEKLILNLRNSADEILRALRPEHYNRV